MLISTFKALVNNYEMVDGIMTIVLLVGIKVDLSEKEVFGAQL